MTTKLLSEPITISHPLADLLFRKTEPPLTYEQALSATRLAMDWFATPPAPVRGNENQ